MFPPSITVLKLQVEELRKDVDKLESKIDKVDAKIDLRFNRLEQMIGLTQTVQQVQECLARMEEQELATTMERELNEA